jgi:two-component system chemotaxis sensor kinase CheA
MDPMAEIREVFFQECEEQLGELESGLLRMQDGTTDAETVNAVFRAVHSIKGGAGIFALDGLVRFAHVFETSLDAIRSGKMQAEQHVMALLLRAADVLMDLVRAARKGETVPESRTQGLVAEFKDLAAGSGAKPAAAAAPAAAGGPPAPPPPAPRPCDAQAHLDRSADTEGGPLCQGERDSRAPPRVVAAG